MTKKRRQPIHDGTPMNPVYCGHCVLPDTIIASEFYNRISEYQVGDKIYGLNGNNSIKHIFNRNYNGELITINPQGMLPLSVTPEHPILAIRAQRFTYKGKKETVFSKPIWILAKNIKKSPDPFNYSKKSSPGDYLLLPRIKNRTTRHKNHLQKFTNKRGMRNFKARGFQSELPINTDVSWLLGLYVADGCVTSSRIMIFLNKTVDKKTANKLATIGSSLGFNPRFTETMPNENMIAFILSSRILSRAIKSWCGTNSYNKHIPTFILNHSNPKIPLAFLEGYIAGDGYIQRINKYNAINISFKTVSITLALQIQLLGSRLGQLIGIYQKDNRKNPGNYRGREIKGCGKIYLGSLHAGPIAMGLGFNDQIYRPSYKVLENYIAVRIKDINLTKYSGPVMNLETEDNTYLANNLIVHNCGHFIANEAIVTGRVDFKCRACGWISILARGPRQEEQVLKVYPKTNKHIKKN